MLRLTLAALCFLSCEALASGMLTPQTRLTSGVLGYDLQYQTYLPEGIGSAQDLPVLFVTDGPGYIRDGKMPAVLDRLIGSGEIRPVVVVFVDARDPDDPTLNRRNAQFLCNRDYLDFYRIELVPDIERRWPVGRSREHRGILGLSFGATNAACFGLMGHDTFALIGMQSPANHPVKNLLPAYEQLPRSSLRMFLSTGRNADNTYANRRFRRVLESKGYDLEYVETDAGHDWDNWRPLIDDVLLYFYGPGSPRPRGHAASARPLLHEALEPVSPQ